MQRKKIDNRLNTCKFQTLVHGDAMPANFCFSQNGSAAALDFQYTGEGCGMKDVIYLMSSSLTDEKLFKNDSIILDRYFQFLEQSIEYFEIAGIDFSELRKEWEEMYFFAWIDFVRFLEGWSPGHARINSYSKELKERLF